MLGIDICPGCTSYIGGECKGSPYKVRNVDDWLNIGKNADGKIKASIQDHVQCPSARSAAQKIVDMINSMPADELGDKISSLKVIYCSDGRER